MKNQIKKFVDLIKQIREMPHLDVHLKLDKCKTNDDFYSRITQEYYDDATARHPKLPLIKKKKYGFALFKLDNDPESFMKAIESSGRRNYKKAVRNNYTFKRIAFNEHIDDIWDIRKSTTQRQGEMPESFVTQRPKEASIPDSNSNTHDYPYFGVFSEEGKLVAYAGCIVAGDLMEVEHVYGHKAFQKDGVVPMRYISMAMHAVEHFPEAKYYAYGSFLGASDTMKRFKKKFQFKPHNITWHKN